MPGTASTSGYPIDSPDIAPIGGTVLSQAVRSAWAKHRRDDDESLSLVRHCEDAAAVAGHLWDDWLPTVDARIPHEWSIGRRGALSSHAGLLAYTTLESSVLRSRFRCPRLRFGWTTRGFGYR